MKRRGIIMRVGALGIASLGVGMALLCLCGCVNCGSFGDSDYASQNDLPRLEALVFKSEGCNIYG